MALGVAGAFAAGVAAGWIGRGLTGSTRGLVVGVVAAALRVRDGMSRVVGQTVEWVEDVMAEGRARYESVRDHLEHDGPQADAGGERRAP